MPELARVARSTKRLSIVRNGLSACKAGNDVVKLKVFCGTATNARRSEEMSVFLAPELLCIIGDHEPLSDGASASNAADVKRLCGSSIVGDFKRRFADVACDHLSAPVGFAVACAGAELAEALFENSLSRLEWFATRKARVGDRLSPKNRCTFTGARFRRPLSGVTRRLIKRATANNAGLVCSLPFSAHATISL